MVWVKKLERQELDEDSTFVSNEIDKLKRDVRKIGGQDKLLLKYFKDQSQKEEILLSKMIGSGRK